ncbi:MAG: hydrogenase expression/formation protein HypE [Armatimonadota bacterium]
MERQVLLAHGGGGSLMGDLIREVFHSRFRDPILMAADDSASLGNLPGRTAFTTDAFVVDPIFFPGGDIGKLAVCGTVNDLAAQGAKPLFLSAAFVLEEGLPLVDLERVVESMASTADDAGVRIVAGDTKVVPRGKADKVFIATSGVGCIADGVSVSGSGVRPGDALILSGPIGDHGIAVMLAREQMGFAADVESDCAPLWDLVSKACPAGSNLHAMRDPTRGGLAAAVNELARQSGVALELEEECIPVRDSVRVACELLGLDPLYVANEGKMLFAVSADSADAVLASLRGHPLGRQAAVIGKALEGPAGRVVLRTSLGTTRIIDLPPGEQLPRIC